MPHHKAINPAHCHALQIIQSPIDQHLPSPSRLSRLLLSNANSFWPSELLPVDFQRSDSLSFISMTQLPSIQSLMSPPETKPLESFSPATSPRSNTNRLPTYTLENRLPPISPRKSPENTRILLSPPVSPWPSKNYKEHRKVGTPESIARDPVLYASSEDGTDSLAEQPLFPSSPSRKAAEDLVSKHMAMHLHQFDNRLNRPTREEYLLALSCVPTLGRIYNHNPGAYMKRVREETEDHYWKAKRICAMPGTKANLPKKMKTHINIAPAPATRQPRKPLERLTPANPVQRVKRTPKPSPAMKALSYPPKGRSETPEFKASGQKRPEDVEYNALPDYAPPVSTLQDNPKTLKADWTSNNPLNLSTDLDKHMLHETEVTLAATLRLSCATYLCSKRRIFEARLNALRIGKDFRKTDAQQACKIDVNKASKLWTAFDKVGWFNKDFFQKHL